MAILFKNKNDDETTIAHSAVELVESLVFAILMALVIKTSIVEAYRIPSGSMEDTLLVGDFLLANKFVYGMRLPIPFTDIKLPAIVDPKPGDIVIFKYPKDPSLSYIKRCIAVGGQTVEIVNKQVYVDGEYVEMPPAGKHIDNRIIPIHPGVDWGSRDNMPKTKVPEGMLFMMGDNRDNSKDSRAWGFLDKRLVMGRALTVHWSWAPDMNSPKISPDDFFSIIKWIAYNIWHFPQRVRWERLAYIIN